MTTGSIHHVGVTLIIKKHHPKLSMDFKGVFGCRPYFATTNFRHGSHKSMVNKLLATECGKIGKKIKSMTYRTCC